MRELCRENSNASWTCYPCFRAKRQLEKAASEILEIKKALDVMKQKQPLMWMVKVRAARMDLEECKVD